MPRIKPALRAGIAHSELGRQLLTRWRDLRFRPLYRYKLDEVNRELAKFVSLDLKPEVHNLVFVCDNRALPPTYGDLLFIVLAARYFASAGWTVRLIHVDDGLRHDWPQQLVGSEPDFVTEQLELSRWMLGPWVRPEGPKSYAQAMESIERADHVVFADHVLARQPVYDLAGLLVALESRRESVPDRFLLSSESLPRIAGFQSPTDPYITWHVRYNLDWGQDRNVNVRVAIKDLRALRTAFPDHAIEVLSNRMGMDFLFESLQHELKRSEFVTTTDLLRPQSSPGFMGAAQLALGSSMHYQRVGGGIGMFPIYSGGDYLIVSGDRTVLGPQLEGGRIVPWAHASQRFEVREFNAGTVPLQVTGTGSLFV